MSIIKSPKRKSIRLPDYDYSRPGSYYITTCTRDRQELFGSISDGVMQLNNYGKIVERAWQDLPNHYEYVLLDQFVVMPNHVHGIIVLVEDPVQNPDLTTVDSQMTHEGHQEPPILKRPALHEIVRAFKTFSAKRINEVRNSTGTRVWQNRYYEHIIRTESDLHELRMYIQNNPLQWHVDELNANRPEHI